MDNVLLRGIKKQKKVQIKVEEPKYTVIGRELAPLNTFSELSVVPPFNSPLLVQKLTVPYFLRKKNVIVNSFTGSGKTLSYAIPLLELTFSMNTKAVVFVPTVQLVSQVHNVFEEMNQNASLIKILSNEVIDVDGVHRCKESDEEVLQSILKGRDSVIIVSTPELFFRLVRGRLADITHIVVDEADTIVDVPFIKLLNKVVRLKTVHLSVFSATITSEVQELVRTLKRCNMIKIQNPATLNHKFIFGTSDSVRLACLLQLIEDGVEAPCLIFVDDKSNAELIHKKLLKSEVYDGKEETLNNFRLKNTWYLITTDELSRGMDFFNIKSVINYGVPRSKVLFVHRAGRVNRNCQGQKVFTIYTTDDFFLLENVVSVLDENGSEIPEHIKRIVKELSR